MVKFDPRIHDYEEYSKLTDKELDRLIIGDITFFVAAKIALALTSNSLIVAATFLWLVAFISLVAIIVSIVRIKLIPTKLKKREIRLDWDPDCWDQLDD